MPIIVVCPSCGIRLQIPDNLAGRRVSCSGCRTVITAPAAPPSAAAPVAVPQPAPVSPPQPPASNPFAFGDEPAAPATRKHVRTRAEDDDEDYAPEPRPTAAVRRGRGSEFATGCGLSKWGAVVEIVGVAYLFLLVELVLLEAAGVLKVTRALSDLGVFVILPFFLPLLAGTAMMGIGRMRMTAAPRQSAAGVVFSTAGISTFVRFVLLLAAMILLLITTSSRDGSNYAAYAVGAMLAAWAIGTLAEMTSVAGVGAVGGALQDRHLYSAAATAGLIHLCVGLVFTFLFLLGYFAGLAEVLDQPRSLPKPGLAAVIQLLAFLLQVAFTYSQYTLYSAGERVERSSRDAA